MKINNVL